MLLPLGEIEKVVFFFFFKQSSSRREVREGAGSNCPKSRRTNRNQVRNSAIFGTNAFVLEAISNIKQLHSAYGQGHELLMAVTCPVLHRKYGVSRAGLGISPLGIANRSLLGKRNSFQLPKASRVAGKKEKEAVSKGLGWWVGRYGTCSKP